MKPMSRFGGGGNYAKKRAGVIERVTQLFHRFDGLMHIND